ncbi:hypothetical protein [Williamsoniiplasma lucivorax]|uniref:Lipoprotein n=1 Tax=Williamsoniiplasma lucivorax TaxID=209274 RepID=A0A2S5RD38_9MOLU|nr:hypothetical protein [Williamsoniiplasma lucivorax]PPE05112.1 hypothetical protein ELUCI_v1c06480 [Williamsoniiplasma lucivorax]
MKTLLITLMLSNCGVSIIPPTMNVQKNLNYSINLKDKVKNFSEEIDKKNIVQFLTTIAYYYVKEAFYQNTYDDLQIGELAFSKPINLLGDVSLKNENIIKNIKNLIHEQNEGL